MRKKKWQHRSLQTLGVVVLVLALVRCVFPGVGNSRSSSDADTAEVSDSVVDTAEVPDSAVDTPLAINEVGSNPAVAAVGEVGSNPAVAVEPTSKPSYYRAMDERPHKIDRNINCAVEFNDSNHVQLVAAEQWGVPPVKNRDDAEQRKGEVVFMGLSPFYDMARLDASIPYLVPRASILLSDIGSLFMDSLQAKGLPLHHIVVSSVLRSEEDVVRLRRTNKNATEQSCHLYGTTFDINYQVYTPLQGREENWERLKWVLSEVLRDLRNQGRCYVKHEVRQPCFHITVK